MSVLNVPTPAFLDEEELRIFADNIDRFCERHAPVERTEKWRTDGQVERTFWHEAGQAGLLGISVPTQYGGGGGDFRHDITLFERIAKNDVSGFSVNLHNGIITPYVVTHGTEEQKQRWLPRLSKGDLVAAIAMSEPAVGSDLKNIGTTAVRENGGYRINGAKTFISHGQLGNFIVVAAKTDPDQGARGVSLIILEDADQIDGFRRGQKLNKMGLEAADTSELFFDDVWVPEENLLGGVEGQGFKQLMTELPRERIIIGIVSMCMIERALETTLEYVKERKAFGQTVFEFQNTQFQLAQLKAEATQAKVFLNYCLEAACNGTLDTTTASMAKLLLTELQGKVVDQCLQFHGGYGYMEEYPICRMYRDARISRVYGGSSEIMRMIIARSM